MALKTGAPQSRRMSWIPRDNDIPALQAELSGFHAKEESNAKAFEAFKSNIIGFTQVSIGKLELQAVLVDPKKDGKTPIACIITEACEAALYESPALIGVNLKGKRMNLEDDAGKPKYIYQIGVFVLNGLKAAANRDNTVTQPARSLVPPSISSVDPEVDIVGSRLQMTVVLSSSDPGFSEENLRVLASDLRCVMSFQQSSASSYYYLVVGDDAHEEYRLYMDNLPQDVSVLDPGRYASVTLLNYKGRDMLLCKEA